MFWLLAGTALAASYTFIESTQKGADYADVDKRMNDPLKSCGCGGSLHPERGEEYANLNGAGCIGGCGGDPFDFHRGAAPADEMEYTKQIQIWVWGDGDHDFRKICMTLSNNEAHCVGNASGNPTCQFDFLPQDRLVDLAIHGNGYGSRTGRLEFTVNRDGSLMSFECGNSHTAYWATNAKDKQISGMFGGAGTDIDRLGIYFVTPKCKIVSQEIVDIQCASPGTGGACTADWTPDASDEYFHLESICDACKAPDGSGQAQCSFEFTWSQSHSATSSSTQIDSLGGSVGISNTIGGGVDIIGLFSLTSEITSTVSMNYAHTWEQSKSQTVTNTETIKSSCSYTLNPGFGIKATGDTRMGNMVADMIYTVRTVTSCDDPDGGHEEVYNGQVTVENVAIITAVSKCEYVNIECDAKARCESTVDCINCSMDKDCQYVKDQGGLTMCKAKSEMVQTDTPVDDCPVENSWMGVAVPVEQDMNCEEAGYEFITNADDCVKAIKDLGLDFHSSTSYKPAPQGCYGRPGMASTGEFSIHPENAGMGAVGERYPICKSYGSKGLTKDQTRAALGNPKSCFKFKQMYEGKPSNKFNTEHVRDCFIACQIAGEKKCAGWSWVMDSAQPCRLFKRTTMAKKGLKHKVQAISAERGCHPDRA